MYFKLFKGIIFFSTILALTFPYSSSTPSVFGEKLLGVNLLPETPFPRAIDLEEFKRFTCYPGWTGKIFEPWTQKTFSCENEMTAMETNNTNSSYYTIECVRVCTWTSFGWPTGKGRLNRTVMENHPATIGYFKDPANRKAFVDDFAYCWSNKQPKLIYDQKGCSQAGNLGFSQCFANKSAEACLKNNLTAHTAILT